MAITGDMSGGFGTYRSQTRPQYHIRRDVLVGLVLHAMAYLSLFRATGMWFGYPSTQNDNATVEPAMQQILLYSLIPFVCAYIALEPKRFLGYLRHVPVAVATLALMVILSAVFSQDFTASVRGILAVVVISLPIVLYKLHYGSEQTMKVLRNFAAFAVLTNLAYTAASPGTGIMGGSLAGSMRGMFLHKNLFGQFNAIAFILLLPPLAAWRPLRYSTLFYAGTAVLALGSAALSLSSTALVLVVVGTATLAIVSLMRFVPGRAVRGYLYLVALTLLILAVYALGVVLAELLTSSVGKDTTFSGRTDVWEALIPAIYEHPFVGHGFALFRQTEYLQIYTSQIPWGPRSTHNSYLEIALNMGVPAAIVWIGFSLSRLGKMAVAMPAQRALRAVRAREVVIMLLVMIGAFTEAGLLFAPLITWVLMLAAIGSPEDTTRHVRRSVTKDRPPVVGAAAQLLRRGVPRR